MCQPTTQYFSMTDEELIERFTAVLPTINPDYKPDWIRKAWVFRAPYAQPVPYVNHSQHVPTIETPLKDVYWASMNHVYPWDRGTNFAIELGRRAAGLMLGQRPCRSRSPRLKRAIPPPLSTWPPSCRMFSARCLPITWRQRARRWRRYTTCFSRNTSIWVARDVSGVIGWIGGQITHDGHVYELTRRPRLHRQRNGVGRALVAALEAEVVARGAGTIFVGSDDEMDRTSVSGIDLYPNPLEHLARTKTEPAIHSASTCAAALP